MYSQGKIVDTFIESYYRVLNNFILQGPIIMESLLSVKISFSQCIQSCSFQYVSVLHSQESQGRPKAERGSQGHRQRVTTKPVDPGQPGPGQSGVSQQQPCQKAGMGAWVMQPEAIRLGEVKAECSFSEFTGQKARPWPCLSRDQAF